MTLNHKRAIELLVEDSADDIGIKRFTLLNLHALLSENLMADPEASGHQARLTPGRQYSADSGRSLSPVIS
jgi:hypothetical protein